MSVATSEPVGLFRQFKPPGPVAAAFMADQTSLVRTLRGPVGGGKTVACIFDGLMCASAMPLCNDGQIYFRDTIIGLTYGQLERNLYQTWNAWLPRDGGSWTEAEFTGGGGRYAKHVINWRIVRNGRFVNVNYEAIFAAIGEQSVEQFMRGFETTRFWLFEMDLLPEAVLPTAITRLGRWPRRSDIAGDVPYRSCVVGDLNAPDVDSWYYRVMEEDRPSGFTPYVQPSGLSPNAENLVNLPRDYYQRQILMLKNKPNLIKRMVLNEYAPSADGQPVYPEYSDDRHLSPTDLTAIKGLDLYLGVDAGLRAPAGVLFQVAPQGQWRILAEVVPGRVGTKTFAALVRAAAAEVAPGFDIARAWCDPAGFSGSVSEEGQLAWAETLMHELGVPIEPTWTNEIDVRLDAVRDELNANIDGTTPAVIISRRCKSLRKGFASHYRYAKRRQASTETLSAKPEKNDWSHVHDACQYGFLGKKGQYGTVASKGRRAGLIAKGGASVQIKNETKLF